MSSSRSRWLVLFASSLLLCLLAAPAEGVVSLDVQITASPEPARPGADLSYEITVTNTGADPNEPAVDVLIQSFVPESTSLDANSPSDGGTVVGNNIFWSIGDLPGAGGQQMVTFALVVNFPAPGLDSIVNGAVVSADNATTVQEIVVTTILPFAVDLTVSAGAGGCAGSPIRTFTAEFVNGSSKSLPGVVLTADIPDSTSLLSAQDGTALCSLDPNLACSAPADCPGLGNSCEVTWDLGTLASEELGKRLLQLSVDETAPGDTEIEATVVITAGPDQDTASTSTTVEDIPCLTLEKADAGSVEPGQVMGYRITATNEGRVAATDVLVSDTLPLETQFSKAGLSFESVIISECAGDETGAESAGVVTWNLETLEPSETVTMCLELNLDNTFEGSLVLNEAILTFSEGDPVTASAATDVTTETALKLRMVAEPATIEI